MLYPKIIFIIILTALGIIMFGALLDFIVSIMIYVIGIIVLGVSSAVIILPKEKLTAYYRRFTATISRFIHV